MTKSPLKLLFIVFALLVAGGVPLLAAERPDREVLSERWSIVELMNQRVGWAVMRSIRQGEELTSEMLMQITIRRGPVTLDIVMGSSFVETSEGKPIRAIADQKMAQTASRTIYEFHEDHITVTNIQSGRRWSQQRPAIEGDWLTPRQAEALIAKKMAAGEKKFSYRSIDPHAGLDPLTTSVEVGEETKVELFGKVVPAIQWRVRTSAMPDVVGLDYVNEQGESLKSVVALGGMEIALIAADEQLAKSKLDPPELLASTLVPIARPIPGARELRQARYRLSVKEGELPDLPTTPTQIFTRIDQSSAHLTIDLDARPTEKKAKPVITRSRMIDGEDERIVALMRRATSEVKNDATERAEAMRRFVYEFVDNKNLGVAMATASEVARTASGDCTEHSVLLAAMLRADGIPSRVVTGLVYADGFIGERQIFGYHMWTQAWIDGQWVDLDSSLSRTIPTDATHIQISASAMDDGEFNNDLVTLVPLIGRLQIEVLDPK